MPIYDYLCANCGRVTEVIHGIDAPGPRFCPACGAEGTLRKAFAPPTVHFKGSGWAKKDRSATRAARSKPAADASEGSGADRSDPGSPAGEPASATKSGEGTSGSSGAAGSESKTSGAKDSGKRPSGTSSAEA